MEVELKAKDNVREVEAWRGNRDLYPLDLC
jgi:hypothetical protein